MKEHNELSSGVRKELRAVLSVREDQSERLSHALVQRERAERALADKIKEAEEQARRLRCVVGG